MLRSYPRKRVSSAKNWVPAFAGTSGNHGGTIMQGSGYIAIWSDLAPEDETDWAHWMTREHSAERVGIEGFLACRIFRAQGTTVNRYFILYELEDQNVVGGAAYLARLNAPTPWSQRTMPRLKNFARGGGSIVASAGLGQGGHLAVLPFDGAMDWDASAVAEELARGDRIAAARVLLTDQAQTTIKTTEKSLRGDDRSFGGLLLIEGLDERAVRDALWRLRSLAHDPEKWSPVFGKDHAQTKGTSRFDPAMIEAQPLYSVFFNLHKRLLPAA